MNMQIQDRSHHYQRLIKGMDLLTIKMEVISQEYFEANVEFISKINDGGFNEKAIKDTMGFYDKRFKSLLSELDKQIKLLKREKIKVQFRKNLISGGKPALF